MASRYTLCTTQHLRTADETIVGLERLEVSWKEVPSAEDLREPQGTALLKHVDYDDESGDKATE